MFDLLRRRKLCDGYTHGLGTLVVQETLFFRKSGFGGGGFGKGFFNGEMGDDCV